MSVRHLILSHQPGAACGVSLFVEGHQRSATVVITELPDNPGRPARESFFDAARALWRKYMKHTPPDRIVWLYRQQGTDTRRDVVMRAFVNWESGQVSNWGAPSPALLGQTVNRDRGFIRQGVFIPRFQPLTEMSSGQRAQQSREVVTYGPC